MTRYTLVTYSAKDNSTRLCLVNSGSIDYIVRIAQLMLYSRDDHDKIEARKDGKSLFVLGRMAGPREPSRAVGHAFAVA